MSATPTNAPPFWEPRPANFQIPAADQHNHAPPGQSGGPPPWAQPYQPKGYPPHQGPPENRRDEPHHSQGPRRQHAHQQGGRGNAPSSSVPPGPEQGNAQDHTARPPRGANQKWRGSGHGRGRGAASRPHTGGESSPASPITPRSPSSASPQATANGGAPPTLDPRAAGFKPRGDRKGPSSARSETTSQASADVDINRYLQDRPPGLPSPDRGTNGHVYGHLPQQGDAALELLALWEEPEEKWPMGADTDGGSSTRAKAGSKARSVVQDTKQESTAMAATSAKETAGQALQTRALTPLVDTSEVPSPITSSAMPGVRDGASSARDGGLDRDIPGLSPQHEACAPQGAPAGEAGDLSGLGLLASVEAQVECPTLATARTASPTTSVTTGRTRTSDESLADYPVLTPTPTGLSFSPVTVTASSSRASESTPDLDDDRSYATSAASAYPPGRSVTSVERRAGPIRQQLREAKIDRLEARIEVLAADLEILRLELVQLRGE